MRILLICVLAAAACSAPPSSRIVPSDAIEQLRAATRPYHSLDSAAAAGYAREVRDCLVHEHHGAMGSPNGVEYIIPYSAWPRDSIAPVAMGQTMRREDNLKIWFLHVWAWKENPDGVFADYHPHVSCPPEARRVFMTSP